MEVLQPPIQIGKQTLVVANHSGGKDSQAMLIHLLQVIPLSQLLVVHASLGEMEWPGALEHAQRQAQNAGLSFIVARAQKTLIDMVEQRFKTRPTVPSWPSAATRQCTSDLKRGPIQREIRAYAKKHGFTTIINCVGIRAEESSKRAKKPPWVHQPKLSTKERTWYDWLPIHKMSKASVFETIKDAGQKPHYAYAAGNDRLSCVFCILASRNDLINGAIHHPALYAKYVELEQKTGYSFHQSQKGLEQITGIKAKKHLPILQETGT